MKFTPCRLFALLTIPNLAFVEKLLSIESDKSHYNLFDPVPDALLRDLDTDRPDKANSPHTLDAGRFQIETGFGSYSRKRDSGVLSENFSWADTTLRMGLNSGTELQLEAPLFQENRSTNTASKVNGVNGGMGDLTFLLKTNFRGNDEGSSATGMAVSMKLPTASHQISNSKVEGAILFLTDFKLAADFDLGINNGVGITANDQGSHDVNVVNVISLSHQIIGPVSGYTELFSSIPTTHGHDWEGTIDTGLLWMVNKNFQVDAGVNFGVTDSASDLQTFVGASLRF